MSRQLLIATMIQAMTLHLLIAEDTNGQNLKDTKLSLDLRNKRLVEIFETIQDKTNFLFAYPEDVKENRNLYSLRFKDETLEKILQKLAIDARVKFRHINYTISVAFEASPRRPQPVRHSDEVLVTIKGLVTDSEGQPLPGVNVLVKGTTVGTSTDISGRYTIQVQQQEAVLVFSFIGFRSKEEAVSNRTVIDVSLEPDVQALEEVVVVGYGTQKKSDLTGSVAVINVNDMKNISTNDLSMQLQGRTPGLLVTSDGQPGAVPTIRLRGVTTFNDAQPLYVIDGIPIDGVPRDFNPNDVETMQVLKDASAGAIYGSRAANGVIIITTRKGKKNQPLSVNVNSYYGIDHVWQRIPVTNTEQYRLLNAEVRANAKPPIPLAPGNDPSSPVYIQGVDTDWQKEALKNGMRQNHSLEFSGGTSDATYLMSLDYFQNEGTLVGNGPDYERYAVRINTTAEKGIFRMGTNLYYAFSHENSLTFRDDVLLGGIPPLINNIVMAIPTMKVYDDTNLGGFGGTEAEIHDVISMNVIGVNKLFVNWIDVDKIYATGFGEIDLLKKKDNNLTYRVNVGWEKTQTRDYAFQPAFDLGYFYNSEVERLSDNSRTYKNGVIENIFTYNRKIGKHNLNATLGYTFQTKSYLLREAKAQDFPSPYYPYLWNGQTPTVGGTTYKSVLSSYLGRINYNYDDRYLITATVRRDGSSKFAPKYRIAYFPAASIGWRLSNESFFTLDKNIFTDVKLRVSYGILGNENIGNYLYLTTVNRNIIYNFNDVAVKGGSQLNIVDETIKWEELTTGNAALDLVLFDGKLDATIEYFNKETKDILVGVPIPLSTGSINTRPTVNAGTINNHGFEFQLGYHGIRGEFSYDIGANYSYITNEVKALGGNEEPIYGTGSKTEVGKPIAQHFGYVYDGIFQSDEEIDTHAFQNANTAPGDIRFRNLNDDNVINEDDRTYLGNSVPKHIYGINLGCKYKGFDLNVFASGAGGYLINSNLYRSMMHTSSYHNWHKDIFDRWTPTNTNTNIPRLVADDPNQNQRNSDRPGWLQDGTYLRINTVQLGYTFNDKVIGKVFSKARVYATIQNLYTFQRYKGFNPDFTAGVFEQGFDFGSYAKPRTTMMGLQLSF